MSKSKPIRSIKEFRKRYLPYDYPEYNMSPDEQMAEIIDELLRNLRRDLKRLRRHDEQE